jgi:succinyl-diaminopimelate desuccinylase
MPWALPFFYRRGRPRRPRSGRKSIQVIVIKIKRLAYRLIGLACAAGRTRKVTAGIAEATAISEPLSGAGESEVLSSVTVTIGTIKGGHLRNLVSDASEATADIRIPVGVTVGQIENEIFRAVAAHEGVECIIDRRFEPTWTPPNHKVIELLARNCATVIGALPVRNMRVGASDARLYRRAGVPTVVCGLTPHNMGSADEYVDVAELLAVGDIFALTAFDFLNAT